jgi:hypothetical protein
MRTVRAKLHSRRGASILLALAFFLLCTMVASVILTSATANVSKAAQRRDEQKAYLSVSSAADLVRKCVNGMTFTRSEAWLHYDCSKLKDSESFYGPVRENPANYYYMTAGTMTDASGASAADEPLGRLLWDGADKIFRDCCEPTYGHYLRFDPTSVYQKSFLLEAAAGKDLFPVSVQLTMESTGNLIFVLRAVEGDKASDKYAMRVQFSGKIGEPETPNQSTGIAEQNDPIWQDLTGNASGTYADTDKLKTSCSHWYTYKDEDGNSQTVAVGADTVFNARTITVSWDTPVIRKGVSE